MKMVMTLKQRGIGLLELMLSLAIIAVLLLMATRYYEATRASTNINDAVDMINAVYAAAGSYQVDNESKYPANLYTLVTDGYLPAVFGSTASANATANPWGGAIAIVGGGTSDFGVTMSGLPSTNVCKALANRISETLTTGSGASQTAGCGTTTTLTVCYAGSCSAG